MRWPEGECENRVSIIAFWSPLHGQGQTSNLHAMAFAMSILHKKRVLMMQTQYDKNNLESPLVGHNVGISSEADELFQDIGLTAAITYSNMSKLSLKLLESCCLTFHNSNLLLLPGSDIKNRETFDREIGKGVVRMIKSANELVDIILIDVNSGNDELSLRIMSAADLIVINLSQRRYVLEKFFIDYGERFIENNKVFYLFGDYDNNSVYNINNFRVKYRKYMNGANSGVIPYCTQYMDAQNESKVLSFMQEGLRVGAKSGWQKVLDSIRRRLKTSRYIAEETDYFFHQSKQSAENILDMLYISMKNNQRGAGRSEPQ